MITCVDYSNGEKIGFIDKMPDKVGCEHFHNDYTFSFKYGVNNIAFFDKLHFNATIENNFKYHTPKDGQPEKYNALREKAKELAYLIDELCPASRERAVAMTELETCVMWANSAIARN